MKNRKAPLPADRIVYIPDELLNSYNHSLNNMSKALAKLKKAATGINPTEPNGVSGQ
ncbi:MAG: hypothetical protein LBR06_00240 [Bacteroidales bacterium]|jgi:hypothetical protein|nr:hypothetical protein [Bacteroidales bacterium]